MPIFDVGRFVAATLVFLVHFQLIFGGYSVIPEVLATSAVSWFFMVSGFILSYKYHDIRLTWNEISRFYFARIARVYPTYAGGLTVAAIFTVVGYYLYGQQFFAYANRPLLVTYNYPATLGVGDFIWGGASHLVFLQLLRDDFTRFLYNPPMWTLANEMLFYLIFPAMIILLRGLQSRLKLSLLLVSCFLFEYALIQLALPGHGQIDWVSINYPVYSNPLIRGIEFLMGVLIYQGYYIFKNENKNSASTLRSWLWLGIAVVGYVIAVLVNPIIPFEFRLFFYLIPIIVLMVWFMATTAWNPHARVSSFCRVLGGASYTIYCFHWPILEMAHTTGVGDGSLVVTAMTLFAIVFIVGVLFSYYVESPIRRLAKPRVLAGVR